MATERKLVVVSGVKRSQGRGRELKKVKTTMCKISNLRIYCTAQEESQYFVTTKMEYNL